MRHLRSWRCSLLAGLALALGACSGSETRCSDGGACNGGSFTATLTPPGGAAVVHLSGKACQCPAGGDWSLGLVDAGGVDSIVIGREAGERPGASPTPYRLPAVAIGATDLGLRARLSFSGNVWICSTGTDGTLDVSASSDANVDGSISVGLFCSLSDGQTTSALLGATFQAVNGPVTLIR